MKEILLLLFLVSGFINATEVIYLSWQEDPTSTMIVHRLIDDPDHSELLIREKINEESSWSSVKGSSRPLSDLPGYHMQRLFLSDLSENSLYEAKFGEEGKPFLFRTAPKKLSPSALFVFGGDLNHDSIEKVLPMYRQMAAQSPLVAVLGGDLAYSFIRSYEAKENRERWLEWLSLWSNEMVTPEGVKIPMIVAIGNHEVGLPLLLSFRSKPLVYELLALDEKKTYRKVVFGDWLALYILDSGHVQSITGPQLNWLARQAKDPQAGFHKIVSYHVPAWPAYRSLSGMTSTKIRRNWSPLFEKMGVAVAFEHHDHVYKRTYPLIEGYKDPAGVVYVGAGAWGGANHVVHKERPFLEKAIPQQSAVVAEIFSDKIDFKAISVEGETIDHFTR